MQSASDCTQRGRQRKQAVAALQRSETQCRSAIPALIVCIFARAPRGGLVGRARAIHVIRERASGLQARRGRA